MPKRISRGARLQARSRRPGPDRVPESLVPLGERASFDPGDVVVERRPPHRLGRVCEAPVPGTVYRVMFEGAVQCAAAAHDALATAPPGSDAPTCPADC